ATPRPSSIRPGTTHMPHSNAEARRTGSVGAYGHTRRSNISAFSAVTRGRSSRQKL
ncbi:hypothetical protein HAX54_052594, partial [Datura stramonium]|nr:hypothetical protein [Datura stramonium]